jgi:hypothetical protein
VIADAGGWTIVDDSVTGSGVNQINYVGTWSHCGPCTTMSTPPPYAESTSWSGVAGDYLTLTFTGSKLELYGVTDPGSGIAAVTIGAAGDEVDVDFYSLTRAGDQLLWSVAVPGGDMKTFRLRVTGTKDPISTGRVVSIDRINIR